MENYIVSARKYRPQTFESVVGQEHITTTLKNAIKNQQLAHAFLFCGPRGVGKTTCARILAKTVNCENLLPNGEACNECASCKAFNSGNAFNIHELDAASNNSVDDIRTLTEQVRFAPQGGKYKVYIIDEVHMLSSSAFNAFLKTLEEPPPYAIFILATTEKHKILPTILSRCQIFDFRRISAQDIVEHLQQICEKENIKADTDALHLIARKSDGCMRDALSLLDKIVSFSDGEVNYENTVEHLNILDYDYFFRIMESVLEQDPGQALLIFDEIMQKGFEADHFVEGMLEFLRDLLVCKDEQIIHLLEVSDNLKNRYRQMAEQIDAAYLISALNLLNEATIGYRQANNKKLHVEMALIRLCYLQQAVELISNENSGEVVKKKLTEPREKAQSLRTAFAHPVKEKKDSNNKKEKATIPSSHKKADPENIQKEMDPPAPEAEAPKPEEQADQIAEGKKLGRAKQEIKKSETAAATTPPASGPMLTKLNKLRNKIVKQQDEKPEGKPIPLDEEILKEKWEEYISLTREQQKANVATNLEMAIPEIIDEREIRITSQNVLQHHFIEAEKLELSAFFQKAFNRNDIIITLTVDESLIPPEEEAQSEILSSRDQYLRMIEKYPLIKELKDKLNLDLEY